jgi:hypothetical protein
MWELVESRASIASIASVAFIASLASSVQLLGLGFIVSNVEL